MVLRAFITACLLSVVPLLGQAQDGELSCRISTPESRYKLGQVPVVTVAIQNNTALPVQLVKVLDGSDIKWRYPHVRFTVARKRGNHYKPVIAKGQLLRCGNVDPIQPADFVQVMPGQAFNPLADQSEIYTDKVILDAQLFKKRGTYRITFYYATDESDHTQWQGDLMARPSEYENGTVSPEELERYTKAKALLLQVPKAKLTSNELLVTFE